MALLMRRLAVFLLPFSLFLLFIGCDSSDPDPGPIAVDSITGTWRGEVPSTNVMGVVDTFLVEININEDRTNVTGDGTVTGPQGVLAFNIIAGSSYLHPIINLDLLFGGPPLGELNGNVAEDRRSIRGTMSGPGFAGIAELQIVLTRMEP